MWTLRQACSVSVCVYLCAHHHHGDAQVVRERAVSQRQQHALLVLRPPLRRAVLAAAGLRVLLELFDNCTRAHTQKYKNNENKTTISKKLTAGKKNKKITTQ